MVKELDVFDRHYFFYKMIQTLVLVKNVNWIENKIENKIETKWFLNLAI